MRLRRWKQKMIVWSPAVTQHRQPHPWRQPGHPLRPLVPPHPPHVSPWGCPSITSTSQTPSCQVSSASLLVSAARRSEVSLCSSIAPSSLFWAVNAVGGWITGKKETKRIFTVKTKHTTRYVFDYKRHFFQKGCIHHQGCIHTSHLRSKCRSCVSGDAEGHSL